MLWVIFLSANINIPVYIHWAAPCDLLLVPQSSSERCRHEPLCPWAGRRWSCSRTAWPRWSESPLSTYNWRTDQRTFKTWQIAYKLENDGFIIVSLYFRLTVQKPESFYLAWGLQEVQPSFGRATMQKKQNEVKTEDERAKCWHSSINGKLLFTVHCQV